MSRASVYSIASGKGGVGKTTMAVNLSAAFASAGERTLVVDADVGMANLADHLGISGGGVTLHDVMADRSDIDAAIVDVGEYLFALPGSVDLDSYASIDPDALSRVVDHVRERYDRVILDGGAGLSYENAMAIGLADEVVLVTDVSAAAVQDTRKTAELARRTDTPVEGVIINNVTSDATPSPTDVATRLGARHLGTVLRSDAITESLRAAKPVLWHDPHDTASESIRSVSKNLTGLDIPRPPQVQSTLPQGDSAESRKPRGLFARLFGR